MSTRVNVDLSNHLLWQAGVTAVFAPFASTGGTGWVMLVLLLAAAAGGLGAYLRQDPPQGRLPVLWFEVVAVAVGVLGVLGHHYLPGTIVAGATLFRAATSSDEDPEPTQPLSALVPVQAGPHGSDGGRITYAPVAVAHLTPVHATAGAVAQPVAGAQAAYAGQTATAVLVPAAAVQPTVQLAAQPASQWAPDPTGRHHYRWWDGVTWTAHVCTQGANGLDPI
jgi:hypothetical protein